MATVGQGFGSTRLHTDLTLAANKCLHSARTRDGRLGARWDIFHPEDRGKIVEYLKTHRGHVREEHPIHAQQYYLADTDIAVLKSDYGVRVFSFTQLPGETVYIPAAAPHEVC